MRGQENIWLRTFAFDTGMEGRSSRLLPIELIERLPHRAAYLEGSLEFRIGGVGVLSNELVPAGYIEDWWISALPAIDDLLALRSTRWDLPGKICHIRIDVIPGTRRATLVTASNDRPHLSPKVEVHIPALVEAMLDEAERFFRWLRRRDTRGELDRIAALRAAPAPWRSGRS